ncbi:DNA polymerase III subunit beta [Cytobacillus sp. IB215316]|uniref:DNA polymerase III subunit beta n=1 Tax=Cytobacillus sp. IB215316 TaxID=3097354 RepID=UPI002A0C4314|nr:DNA polymerase III subunit beta [Cytobacillus sp. IB215316]MDX8361536.1 DNA polymerase III subunit beta [Cytobacillus sp. IB215316]
MEFTINNEHFKKAMKEVSRAISYKTPLPILTGVKVIANQDSLTLIGSNSDIVIEKTIPAVIDGLRIVDIYHTGSIVISAKYLHEIVKKLPDQIHVKANDNHTVTIQSADIITSLNGMNADEYPSIPEMDESQVGTITGKDFIDIIKQTSFAVSKNESRPILTGVLMLFQQGRLTVAATNSHRLALREHMIESNIHKSFIVPSSCLNELTKLIDHESDIIEIHATENHIAFSMNNSSIFSRLIEGNYPSIHELIPKDAKTVITVNTKQLLNGIDRASLFANEWTNNNIHLEIVDKSKLKISSNSSQIGQIEEIQSVKTLSGESELSISLDGSFLMDALRVINEEDVSISFGGSMKPILLQPLSNISHLHLISPVRTY